MSGPRLLEFLCCSEQCLCSNFQRVSNARDISLLEGDDFLPKEDSERSSLQKERYSTPEEEYVPDVFLKMLR